MASRDDLTANPNDGGESNNLSAPGKTVASRDDLTANPNDGRESNNLSAPGKTVASRDDLTANPNDGGESNNLSAPGDSHALDAAYSSDELDRQKCYELANDFRAEGPLTPTHRQASPPAIQPALCGGGPSALLYHYYPALLLQCGSPLTIEDIAALALPPEMTALVDYRKMDPRRVDQFLLNASPAHIAELRQVPGFIIGKLNGEEYVRILHKGRHVFAPSRSLDNKIQALQFIPIREDGVLTSYFFTSNDKNAPAFTSHVPKVISTPHFSGVGPSGLPLTTQGHLQLGFGVVQADIIAYRKGSPAVGVLTDQSWEKHIVPLIQAVRPSKVIMYYDVWFEPKDNVEDCMRLLKRYHPKVICTKLQ